MLTCRQHCHPSGDPARGAPCINTAVDIGSRVSYTDRGVQSYRCAYISARIGLAAFPLPQPTTGSAITQQIDNGNQCGPLPSLGHGSLIHAYTRIVKTIPRSALRFGETLGEAYVLCKPLEINGLHTGQTTLSRRNLRNATQ